MATACPVAFEDEILTPEEAAALLKLNVATVREKLNEGALPGWKLGRMWRLRKADLYRVLAGNYPPIAAPRPYEPR